MGKKIKIFKAIDSEGKDQSFRKVKGMHDALFKGTDFSYLALLAMLRRHDSFSRGGYTIEKKDLL